MLQWPEVPEIAFCHLLISARRRGFYSHLVLVTVIVRSRPIHTCYPSSHISVCSPSFITVMNIFVCLSVWLSARISRKTHNTTELTKFCKCRGSVLLWRRCTTLSGAVLAPPLFLGGGVIGRPEVSEAGHQKIFVGHVYKYVVFDVKPT